MGTPTSAAGPPVLAFHLPQFHPTPENDAWWGAGFTEWTNVTRARPLFTGHHQPHLPADLGFYDLRLPEARQSQADLARAYGISGFVYYHYWFGGRRLLNRPVDEILASGEPDFPFCLCWANEPWSRNWDGGFKKVLVAQEYSPADDLAHIRHLLPAFADPRYIRVDGKPLFLVYKASQLPDPHRTTDCWREEARKAGLGDLFLARVQNHAREDTDPGPLGFDAAVQFAPDWRFAGRPRAMDRVRHAVRARLYSKSERLALTADRVLKAVGRLPNWLTRRGRAGLHNGVLDYDELVDFMLALPDPAYRRFPGVSPGWDNTARRKTGAVVYLGSTPVRYEHWLRTVVQRQRASDRPADPVFVNAWNEWAEGCHLEPCQRWGRAYLEATARAVRQVTRPAAIELAGAAS